MKESSLGNETTKMYLDFDPYLVVGGGVFVTFTLFKQFLLDIFDVRRIAYLFPNEKL